MAILKLTPKLIATIAKHVSKGSPRKYAALAAGVAEVTVKKWVARGRSEKTGIYVSLVAALKDAEGSFVASNVAVIKKAANGVKETVVKESVDKDGNVRRETTTRKVFEWTAAAWLLERRVQEEFGASRNELKELKKMLVVVTAKLEALTNGQQQGGNSTGKESSATQPPNVGGEADPASI